MALYALMVFCFLASVATADVLLYVVQWASEQKLPCREPVFKGEFTIHGIWPSKDTGGLIKTKNCPKQEYFDDKIESIKSELNLYWPDIFKEGSNEPFGSANGISMEYAPNGRCVIIPVLPTLLEHQIFPGGIYDTDAIKSSFDGKAVLRCNKHEGSSQPQL